MRTRTVASAIYNMSVQLSNIISSQIYRDNDKPLYRTGNAALIAVCAYNFLLFVGLKLFYVYVNRYVGVCDTVETILTRVIGAERVCGAR